LELDTDVDDPPEPQYIDFWLLGADPMPKDKVAYADVEKHFRSGGRIMLPRQLRDKSLGDTTW
jgi:hypothetical protein